MGTDSPQEDPKIEESKEEKPFLKVIVHSFFIIPFLIAVFCVLLFAGIHLLTSEKRSVYDYLEDIKTGGLNKRWQGAFELSKILANPEHVPEEERFVNEMITAFQEAKHEDDRVRQYLALAMGRTQDSRFSDVLLNSLDNEKEKNLAATIYALGMLKQKNAADSLHQYMDHPNARIRSITAVSLGTIANRDSIPVIKKGLSDPEENVQWGAAVSLARMGDDTGKNIIAKMLERPYWEQFPKVDEYEQNQLILTAIDAAKRLGDDSLLQKVKKLASQDENMKVRAKAKDIITRDR